MDLLASICKSACLCFSIFIICKCDFFSFESCFGISLDLCYDWNNTPSYIHYFNYLEIGYILGACGNDGEVDDV